MNSLTTKLRKIFLVAAIAAFSVVAIQNTNAQVSTATATLFSGGSNTINITGNQTFTMQLSVTTNFVSSGYTVFYMVSANGSGLFRMTARTNDSPFNAGVGGPVFGDPTTPDATAFNAANGLLDPTNNNDLGYTGDQTNNQPAGTFALQTITVNALNVPAGQYQIFTSQGVMTDRTGGGFNDVPFATMLTINVIPEPTTVGLAVIGGALLLVVVWRKQRAARA